MNENGQKGAKVAIVLMALVWGTVTIIMSSRNPLNEKNYFISIKPLLADFTRKLQRAHDLGTPHQKTTKEYSLGKNHALILEATPLDDASYQIIDPAKGITLLTFTTQN